MSMEISISNTSHTLQVVGCQFGVKSADWSYPRHHHHLFELCYCWEGTGELTVGDETIVLRAGELLLLKPGIKHHSCNRSADRYAFFNIHFHMDDKEVYAHLTTAPYRYLDRDHIQRTRLPAYFREMEGLLSKELLQSGPPLTSPDSDHRYAIQLSYRNRLFFQGHILLIIQEVLSLLLPLEPEPAAELPLNAGSVLQIDAAHAIEARLQNTGCVKGAVNGIAKEQNLSRSQCYKIFTQVYGMSPRQYLTQIKLNQAKQLLLNSELTVEAISRSLGFATISHFSRQFKRWTGSSPNQFRPRR